VIGEWMPIIIFKVVNGQLQKMDLSTLGFEHSNGFWNKLVTTDIDGDGDLDLFTGNLGLNSNYRADKNKPIQCYATDYDHNGSMDPIMTYYEGDKCFPFIQKDVLIKQIPSMKKKFVFYKDYANATIHDILTPEQIKQSLVLSVYQLQSGWWENIKGRFTFHPFPVAAQASPVYGIIASDFNQDGYIDIILAGNKYQMEVETGRLDAGVGCYFEGDGKGHLKWINNIQSGFWAEKEVRDLALLQGPADTQIIMVSNNNDRVQVYRK
jgi:hypothetical protein